MINYTRKYQKYIDFIKTALQNKNIDNDDHEWETTAPLQSLIYPSSPLSLTNSVSLGIIRSELLLLVQIKEKLPSVDSIINAIDAEIKGIDLDQHGFETLNIIWIMESIDFKIQLRYQWNHIHNQIKNSFPIFAKILPTYYVDKDLHNIEIKLNNTKRPEMLLLPPLEPHIHIQENANDAPQQYPEDLKGYMLTANLYDIIEIYNQVGDILFKDNVRFGIAEQLGVDKAIKDTLKNAPNYFWFRNNGITLLIEEPDRILDNANEIILKRKNDEKIKFSVINGAQTITASAEYFYTLQAKLEEAKSKGGDKEDNLKIEFEKAKKAKVVLRIIQIKGQNIPDEAKRISVALNRQKPIKMEDIAFTNYFVEKMNSYLESNRIGYSLAKRSEISYSPNEFSLVDFARARKACSGEPGLARNKDAAAMLKLQTSKETSLQSIQKFSETDIFVEEWYSSKDASLDEKIFNKYYSPVLFAIKLANSYENKYKEMITHDPYYNTVIKNGKWYFVSFLIFALNGNDTDYSEFKFTTENLKQEEIISLIAKFAEYYCKLFKESIPKIDSNNFKKKEQYTQMKESNYKESEFYSLLSQIFELSNDTKQKNSKSKRNSSVKVTTVKLRFNNTEIRVSSAADAFSYTVSECLKYAYRQKISLESFLQTCPYISTLKRETGYFRTKTPVTINNRLLFIGRSHSFDTKALHIDKLCEHLKLAAGSICWMNGQEIVYKNP